MKFIQVLFSNGETFEVPATTIAHDRATYYANHDVAENPNADQQAEWLEVYAKERTYTLGDEEEIMDWACNNMNWEDVVEDAVRVQNKGKVVDKHSEWSQNEPEKEIVEHD